MPSVAISKTINRLRRHNHQVAELNATRDELHLGNWDGLILATELSPLSILARLTPYLGGSAQVVVYSPYLQILAEVLQYAKKNPSYLGPTLTESWSRTYQVLPGRTHPLMTTSGSGGYLFHATKVYPSDFHVESSQRFQKRRKAKQLAKAASNERNGDVEEDLGVGVGVGVGSVDDDEEAEEEEAEVVEKGMEVDGTEEEELEN